MLVLARKPGESIEIKLPDARTITVEVVEIRHDKCRIGVTADRDIIVNREEIARAIERNPNKPGNIAST
jgi:carbon storage regulator CsrA